MALAFIGVGGQCRSLISIAGSCGISVATLFDYSDTFDPDEVILGAPVRGHLNRSGSNAKSVASALREYDVLIAAGNNGARREVAGYLSGYGLSYSKLISSHSFFDESSTLGSGSVVSHGAVIHGNVKIGKHCIINSGAIVEHDCRIGDYVHVGPGAVLCGNVRLDDGVFCGANSTLLPETHLGAGVVVGAGSVVLDSCPEPGRTIVGSPARMVNRL